MWSLGGRPRRLPGDGSAPAGSATSSPMTVPDFACPVVMRCPSRLTVISSIAGQRRVRSHRSPVVEQKEPMLARRPITESEA